MKNYVFILLALFSVSANAQETKHLLGVCTRDSLLKPDHKTWFSANYQDYNPEEKSMSKLKMLKFEDYSFEIFFGTWCGDSRREVPRFFKITDALGIQSSKIKLIAVNTGEQYKQSPGGETTGKGIYRVATFIVYRNGKEVNRITEHPVRSLELDLVEILTSKTYQSNFKSYPLIDSWINDGLIAHSNTSLRGLAKQLKPLLISPSELNACGHVLLAQSKIKEAVAVFRFNAYIFFDNVDVYVSLAEALSKDSQHKEAGENMETAFSLNEDDSRWRELLEVYYTVKKAAN